MKQIIFIHGGVVFPDNETFCKVLETRDYSPFEGNKKWIDWLTEKTQGTYQVFKPTMPNKYNANYKSWKIWFEKNNPFLNDEDLVLVGHSLGGMFLIKYLGENSFPKKIKQLHLVSACIDDEGIIEEEKYLGDFEFNPGIISKLQDIVEQIFVYHSTDDVIVPYSHAEKIKAYLPNAKLITFTDRGHFSQPEFPELLENIIK